jgi:hypothetical protein
MTKPIIFSFLIGMLFFQSSLAQAQKDSLYLKINLKFKDQILELNKNYISRNDTLQINVLKFYLSEIEILYIDKTTFVFQKKHHLIDIEKSESLQIPIGKKNNKIISKIQFNIGIDSLSSVSGALSEDLDLQNGMYWAWQSGYINMKIEGRSRSSKNRKNAFQFHIGGYLQPNYAMRTIELNYNENVNRNDNLNLGVDLANLFENIDLKQKHTIMIPGEEAMQMAAFSINMFRLE